MGMVRDIEREEKLAIPEALRTNLLETDPEMYALNEETWSRERLVALYFSFEKGGCDVCVAARSCQSIYIANALNFSLDESFLSLRQEVQRCLLRTTVSIRFFWR